MSINREDLSLRIRFEEARALERALGSNSTPEWGQHNIIWWETLGNSEGYLEDLRRQARERGLQLDEAAREGVRSALDEMRIRLQEVEQQLSETEGIYKERVGLAMRAQNNFDSFGSVENLLLYRGSLNAREDNLMRRIESSMQRRRNTA